jgi:hypothetical protein
LIWFDLIGLDWIGFDLIWLDWIGLDWIGFDYVRSSQLAAIGDWAGATKLYDYARVRTLHATKVALPSSATGAGGGDASVATA